MINYPDELNIIFDRLHQNRIRAVIVGGYIRDALMGVSSKDIDVELYGLSSILELENILQEFGDVNSVGKSFGVSILKLKTLSVDFTLPRVDSKISSGHKGFEISIDSSMDFKTAAKRRDFTMNAMGLDIQTKEFLDPYNGLKDLKKKILKEVDARTFKEDPLRILRAVQFCARFNLQMSSSLFFLCQDMLQQNLLSELSQERIFAEYSKLLQSSKPSIGFKLLKELSILEVQNFNDVMLSVDYFATIKTKNTKTDTVIMLTILTERLSEQESVKFISKFTAEKKTFTKVHLLKEVYASLSRSIKNNSLEDIALYKGAQKVKISELLLLYSAMNLSKKVSNRVEQRAKKLNILETPLKPLIQGRDIIKLGVKASNKFSKILNDSYEAQMKALFSSKEEAIFWLKNYLKIS
jgi:tRNA nucleotidyltransferase (CCA-adding enzyme)